MILPNIGMLESAGVLVASILPQPSSHDVDFSKMFAAVAAKAEPVSGLPMPSVTDQAMIVSLTPSGSSEQLSLRAANQNSIDDREVVREEPIALSHTVRSNDNPDVDVLEAAHVVAMGSGCDVNGIPSVTELVVVTPVTQDAVPEGKTQMPAKTRVIDRVYGMAVPQAADFSLAVAAPVVADPVRAASRSHVEMPNVTVAPAVDSRSALLMPTSEKPAPPMPDRVATFAPLIADAVRDLVNLAQNKDIRFHVRPEVLGPVSVTIERSETGPTLRLGVETQAAVRAVRHAEPMMNDARGHAPFVHVTVDLNASDQRGRSARMPIVVKQQSGDVSQSVDHRTTLAVTGRYA